MIFNVQRGSNSLHQIQSGESNSEAGGQTSDCCSPTASVYDEPTCGRVVEAATGAVTPDDSPTFPVWRRCSKTFLATLLTFSPSASHQKWKQTKSNFWHALQVSNQVTAVEIHFQLSLCFVWNLDQPSWSNIWRLLEPCVMCILIASFNLSNLKRTQTSLSKTTQSSQYLESETRLWVTYI